MHNVTLTLRLSPARFTGSIRDIPFKDPLLLLFPFEDGDPCPATDGLHEELIVPLIEFTPVTIFPSSTWHNWGLISDSPIIYN